MGAEFKVVTLKPLNVGNIGWVEAGVDVTDQLGDFRHLASLVDMGDVALIPDGVVPVARSFSFTPPVVEEKAEPAEAETLDASSEAPTEEAPTEEAPAEEEEALAEEVEPVVEVEESLQYMDDPSGFTIEEVLAYAESHPEHASMLLELETEGKGRKRIIKALTALSES